MLMQATMTFLSETTWETTGCCESHSNDFLLTPLAPRHLATLQRPAVIFGCRRWEALCTGCSMNTYCFYT